MEEPPNFLSRWSRRKVQVREGKPLPPDPAPPAAPAVPAPAAAQVAPEAPPAPLPPVETLTHESDFTAYLKPGVDPDVRRKAMHLLLRDPRFNVMDGLDIYTGDFSQPDPLPPGWLEQLNQVARLGAYEEPAVTEAAAEEAPEGKGAPVAANDALEVQPVDPAAPSVTPDAVDGAPEVRQ